MTSHIFLYDNFSVYTLMIVRVKPANRQQINALYGWNYYLYKVYRHVSQRKPQIEILLANKPPSDADMRTAQHKLENL